MRIPEIQARFRELARVIAKGGGTIEIAAEIEMLVDELSRRAAVTRAPVQATPTTPVLRRAIRALHLSDPDLTQAQIARRLGVNQGRVSEALAGKRK